MPTPRPAHWIETNAVVLDANVAAMRLGNATTSDRTARAPRRNSLTNATLAAVIAVMGSTRRVLLIDIDDTRRTADAALLTYVNVPTKSGLETLASRQGSPGAPIPTVMLTAEVQPELLQQASERAQRVGS